MATDSTTTSTSPPTPTTAPVQPFQPQRRLFAVLLAIWGGFVAVLLVMNWWS